jgi:hypothetical protein
MRSDLMCTPRAKFAAFLVLLVIAACGLLCRGAVAEDVGDPNAVWPEDAIGTEVIRNPLTGFQFLGMTLGAPIGEFLEKFPTATRDDDPAATRAGASCYVVEKLVSVDEARFYFLNGKLFQIEMEYSAPRVTAMGGSQALVMQFVKAFGRPDHAYVNRRTWQETNKTKRADLYTSRDGAVLVVTDMLANPRISEAERRTAIEQDPNLGL